MGREATVTLGLVEEEGVGEREGRRTVLFFPPPPFTPPPPPPPPPSFLYPLQFPSASRSAAPWVSDDTATRAELSERRCARRESGAHFGALLDPVDTQLPGNREAVQEIASEHKRILGGVDGMDPACKTMRSKTDPDRSSVSLSPASLTITQHHITTITTISIIITITVTSSQYPRYVPLIIQIR